MGSFPLQTSLISPNFPARQPPQREQNFFRFSDGGCRTGKFLADWEVRGFCRVRLRARFIGDRCFTTHSPETTRFHFWWMCLMGGALCRGVIRRERPSCRSAPSSTNLNRFYPVAERDDSRANSVNGIGLGAAGNSSTEYGYTKTCTTKRKGQKSPWLKFLKVLRKILSRSFLSGFGQSPRSYDLGQSPKVL